MDEWAQDQCAMHGEEEIQQGTSPPLALISSSASAPPAKTIRRRRLRACDSCRNRKIRCDDNPKTCHNCEVYKTECSITRDGVRTLRKPRAQGMRSRLDDGEIPRPESLVAGQSKDGNPITSWPALHHGPEKESENDFGKQGEGSILPEVLRSPETRQRQIPSTSGSTYISPSEMIQGVVVTETGRFPQKSKYAGMSSCQVLAKSAEELFKHQLPQVDVMKFFCPLMNFAEEITINPTYSYALVDKTIADRCVDRFFSTYHMLFPILDPITFYANFQSFYCGEHIKDRSQVACILLVIALGTTRNDDPGIHSAHFNAAWALYHQFLASPYIGSVQALVLMTLDLINFHKDGQAILSIGLAVRIAQSIGLHRSLSAHRHPHEKDFVRKEHSLRNCVWWACYCLDKKLCFEGGRPSAICDEDCDADMPEFQDIEFRSGTSPTDSTSKPNSIFFCSFIGLCRVLSSITSQLFSRYSQSQSEALILSRITGVEDELLAWKKALPTEIQPEQELGGIRDQVMYMGAALLHCVYHNAMLVVHRASLIGEHTIRMRTHENPRIVASDAVCLNAARSLARSVNDWTSANSESLITRWTTFYSINTVFVLYIAMMKTPTRWSFEMDYALMKSMAQSLQQNDDSKVFDSFQALMDSLCLAIENVRRNEHRSSSTPSRNDFISNRQLLPGASSSSMVLTESGQPQEIVDNQTFDVAVSERLSDTNDELGGYTNFQWEDFFGDDPNVFNVQFWPTGLLDSL